jgi:dCTP deaminase
LILAFWSGEKLESELEKYVEPFNPKAVDCAAYTLSVGAEVYVSPDRAVDDPSRHTKQTLGAGESFAIPPGQFAFLTTKETIEVPDTAIAFISIRARSKFRGLVNISGFHVDPGYKGQLVFSVLNAGPTPHHLAEGEKLFLIWYADLDQQTEKKKKPEEGFGGLNSKLVNDISGEILSLQSLSERQRQVEKDLVAQISAQQTRLAQLSAFVGVMIALNIALFTGALLEWWPSATP